MARFQLVIAGRPRGIRRHRAIIGFRAACRLNLALASMSTSLVSAQIWHAFAHASLVQHAPVSIDTYDDEGASATFKGRRWREVSSDELRQVTACLNFFTPAAVVAYLPAFIVAALEHPHSGVADCTIAFIKPPKANPFRPSYFAWWSLLSPSQRLAVIAFLRAMPEPTPGEYLETIAVLEAVTDADAG